MRAWLSILVLLTLLFSGCAAPASPPQSLPQPVHESEESPYLEEVSEEIDQGIVATLRVVKGIVVVNGRAADTGTPLKTGDLVKTGLDSEAFVIYQDDREDRIPADTAYTV